MENAYLDTNLFIRFLTKDHPDHAQRAYRVFKQIEDGTTTVTTSGLVIAEVVHVLSSKALYALPRQDLRAKLTPLLTLNGLKLPYKRTYKRALDVYASSNLDFVDAYLVAEMERTNITTIVSFDRDFDSVPGITRKEPWH
jgi:predicted nucleic acid-binding protein